MKRGQQEASPPAQGGNDATFRTLRKCIKNEAEVALFKRSETFAELMGFVLGCNQAGAPAAACSYIFISSHLGVTSEGHQQRTTPSLLPFRFRPRFASCR